MGGFKSLCAIILVIQVPESLQSEKELPFASNEEIDYLNVLPTGNDQSDIMGIEKPFEFRQDIDYNYDKTQNIFKGFGRGKRQYIDDPIHDVFYEVLKHDSNENLYPHSNEVEYSKSKHGLSQVWKDRMEYLINKNFLPYKECYNHATGKLTKYYQKFGTSTQVENYNSNIGKVNFPEMNKQYYIDYHGHKKNNIYDLLFSPHLREQSKSRVGDASGENNLSDVAIVPIQDSENINSNGEIQPISLVNQESSIGDNIQLPQKSSMPEDSKDIQLVDELIPSDNKHNSASLSIASNAKNLQNILDPSLKPVFDQNYDSVATEHIQDKFKSPVKGKHKQKPLGKFSFESSSIQKNYPQNLLFMPPNLYQGYIPNIFYRPSYSKPYYPLISTDQSNSKPHDPFIVNNYRNKGAQFLQKHTKVPIFTTIGNPNYIPNKLLFRQNSSPDNFPEANYIFFDKDNQKNDDYTSNSNNYLHPGSFLPSRNEDMYKPPYFYAKIKYQLPGKDSHYNMVDNNPFPEFESKPDNSPYLPVLPKIEHNEESKSIYMYDVNTETTTIKIPNNMQLMSNDSVILEDSYQKLESSSVSGKNEVSQSYDGELTFTPDSYNSNYYSGKHVNPVWKSECDVGTYWEANCYSCYCYHGEAVCQGMENCSLRPFGEPMFCKPYSTFKLDDCYVCQCNGDGIPQCSIGDCEQERAPKDESNPIIEFFDRDIAKKLIQYYINNHLMVRFCPKPKKIQTCEVGTVWRSSCYDCKCNKEGIRVCVKIDDCQLVPQDHGKPTKCKPNTTFFPKTMRYYGQCHCTDEGEPYCPAT